MLLRYQAGHFCGEIVWEKKSYHGLCHTHSFCLLVFDTMLGMGVRYIFKSRQLSSQLFFLKKISRQLPSQLCAQTFSLSQLSSKLYFQIIFPCNCQVTCVTKN